MEELKKEPKLINGLLKILFIFIIPRDNYYLQFLETNNPKLFKKLLNLNYRQIGKIKNGIFSD